MRTKEKAQNRWLSFSAPMLFIYAMVITLAITLHVTGVYAQGGIILNPLQIAALTIFAFICGLDYIWVTPFGIWRPTIAGTVTGIIVGQPLLGLITGSLIEFTFLGLFTIGGGTVPEAASGTIVAVTLGAIIGVAATPEEAAVLVPIAWPVAALTMNIEILVRAGDAIFTHWADSEIAKGNYERVGLINILGAIPWALSRAIPVGIFAALGASPTVAEAIRKAIEDPSVQPIWNAMAVAGWWMPALGVALLLRIFYRPEYLPYFIWGFVLVAYFNLSLLAVAILSTVLVGAIYIARWVVQFGEFKLPTGGEEAVGERILTKGDLIKAFWLSWFIQSSWNYERMMGTGYAHGMYHIEKKLRKTPEELKEWMTMHTEFYNTEPHLHNIILGMTIAMEERGSDIETIRAIKTALMGPFAGLGDSIMWFTLLPIAFAIGASIGAQGNFLGPLLALIIWVPASWLIKYYSLIYGYKYGDRLAEVLSGEYLKFFRDAIAAFAVAMMGGIGASYVVPPVFVQLQLWVTPTQSLQGIFNMILPRLLALLIVLYAYWLVSKRGLSLSLTVIVLFLTGIGFTLLHFIGAPGAYYEVYDTVNGVSLYRWIPPTIGEIIGGLISLIVAFILIVIGGKKKE